MVHYLDNSRKDNGSALSRVWRKTSLVHNIIILVRSVFELSDVSGGIWPIEADVFGVWSVASRVLDLY